jgi:hypothetical protein
MKEKTPAIGLFLKKIKRALTHERHYNATSIVSVTFLTDTEEYGAHLVDQKIAAV